MSRADSQALQASLGVWSDPRQSAPVDASDIRRWAIAVYWPETPPRLYFDEAYAKTTRWGGLVAPREFNPFAWPAERPASMVPHKANRGVGERTMNGGQREKYGAVIRVGDVITARSALVKLEKKSTRLGATLLRHIETVWTNQRGEFVKSRTQIVLQY